MPAPSDFPQRIGPYRVLERLGAGGMGEVFLAYDERLDRRVAIKRIRPESEVSADRRERFRREARLAARLSHPAIVQVYDILHEGDFDHIVLEYVQGKSLWEHVEDGPMDVGEVLDLARELADGLEAAHRQGIIHRDFKSENVLVTPSGRPRITDFGIAKELLGGDESLTRANAVLGTCRVMSPEQARGEAVDHRTDLFAFGVLLYEMLTGLSPFTAENSLATLNRVIHYQPKPVREINRAVPEGLSSLIDHLLQKDPALRPRDAGQVRRELDRLALATADYGGTATTVEASPLSPAAPAMPVPGAGRRPSSALTVLRSRPRLAGAGVAVLVAIAAAAAYLVSRPPQKPLYVGVLRPEIGAGAGSAETELLASGVRVALLQGLVSLEGISPKGFDEIDAVEGSPRKVARAVSADEVVGSRLDCRPEACRISLNRLRGQDGSVLWAESFEVPTDDYSVLASAVTQQLRGGYSDHRVRKGTPELAVSSRDLKEFLRLRRSFDAREETSFDALLQGLEAIRQRSPRFLDVYLLEAEVARRRFFHSRDREDFQRGLQRIDEARELAPNDPQPLFALTDLALIGDDVELAERTLDELERLAPGDVRLLERRARILNARGRSDEALSTLRTAARLHPSSKRLHNLAQMEYQQGRIAEARSHLDLLLQRSPGDVDGLSLLAAIELSSGDLSRAVRLYNELVRRSPGPSQLSNLGLAYFFLGRYADAARTFHRVLERDPNNPLYTLNLADAYFLLGERARADALYRRVVDLVENDPSATGPQFLTVKAQALAHLGQGPQAVAAVQEALRLAPGQGAVAYEASLVYALLGEESSALVNAEKAVALGIEERWFSFPWFAPLESRAEFQDLMKRAR